MLHPDSWVVGLREGTGLHVEGTSVKLLGEAQCRVFRAMQEPRELTSADDFSFLLE